MIAKAKALREQGRTIVSIANELGCSPTTIWMWLNFQGAGTGRDIRKAAS